MKVILFVGHHKVGSTALQRYLARNAPALARQGILYPVVTEPDLERLRALVDSGADHQPLSRNVTEAHNALAFSVISGHTGRPVPDYHPDLPGTNAMFALIRRQYDLFEPHTVIIASEVLANLPGMDIDLVNLVRRRLHLVQRNAEVALHVYLRRIDDYLASWHGQRLRFGQKLKPLPQAMPHYFGSIHFNYTKLVAGWYRPLRPATLALHRYDEARAAGGTVQHFMDVHGLPLVHPETARRTVNPSIHRGFLEFARQANLTLDPDAASAVFGDLLSSPVAGKLPASSDVELYGAEVRQRMHTRFSAVNDRLSTLAGREIFTDTDTLLTPRPVPEIEANRQALERLAGRFSWRTPRSTRRFLRSLSLQPNY